MLEAGVAQYSSTHRLLTDPFVSVEMHLGAGAQLADLDVFKGPKKSWRDFFLHAKREL